jgi:hypothetical protein
VNRILTAICVLLLCGCQSDISTVVDVRENGAADVSMQVVFSGEVLEKLQDPQLSALLEEQLRARFPGLTVSNGGSTYQAKLTSGDLQRNADLSGVADIRIDRSGDVATVSVQLVDPTQLEAAILDSVAGSPDAEALAKTIANNTTLSINIRYPGQVLDSGGGLASGTTATYQAVLATWDPGMYITQGSLKPTQRPLVMYVGAALLLGILLTAAMRRR